MGRVGACRVRSKGKSAAIGKKRSPSPRSVSFPDACFSLPKPLRTLRADRIKQEVVELFQNAVDPDTGAKLFIDAFQVAERYRLDPRAEGLPDVLAFLSDGYQAQAKWNPFRRELLAADPNLPATHYRQGVIAIDAPDLRPGNHLDADLRDVAPTALALLGLRIPEGMHGRVLHEAFEEPLLVRRGVRRAIVTDNEFNARLVAAGFGEGQD